MHTAELKWATHTDGAADIRRLQRAPFNMTARSDIGVSKAQHHTPALSISGKLSCLATVAIANRSA